MKNPVYHAPFTETIEIEITQSHIANKRINFTNKELMSDAMVCAVVPVLAGISPQGRAINGLGGSGYLTLYDGSKQRHKDVSFYSLQFNTNYARPFLFEPFQVQFQQSYITISDPTSVAVGQCVMIQFHYYPRAMWEKMQKTHV